MIDGRGQRSRGWQRRHVTLVLPSRRGYVWAKKQTPSTDQGSVTIQHKIFEQKKTIENPPLFFSFTYLVRISLF